MTDKHYSQLANSSYYGENFFGASDGVHQKTYLEKITQFLNLQPSDILLDIGAGNGFFTSSLKEYAKLRNNPTALEPNQEMVRNGEKLFPSSIDFVCNNFTDWIETNPSYSKFNACLMKEMIHHIKDLKLFFQTIYKVLPSKGKFLILTRSSTANELPLFKQAKKVWSETSYPLESILEQIERCGFRNIQINQHTIEAKDVELEKWFLMLRSKFWSCLSLISDVEMEQGIDELREKYGFSPTFTVCDPIIYITGEKP